MVCVGLTNGLWLVQNSIWDIKTLYFHDYSKLWLYTGKPIQNIVHRDEENFSKEGKFLSQEDMRKADYYVSNSTAVLKCFILSTSCFRIVVQKLL